jgi:16S rRNA (guanine966-N2)-methyltransferase
MANLRITAGELRGRRLSGPRRGDQMRPTTERVREAVFSILGDVGGARVLDLFCGTGALGLEALSRGAAEVTLVDSDPRLAQRNVEALGVRSRARPVRSEALRYLDRAPEASFDLVLCDPPYGFVTDRLTRQLDPLLRRALAPGGRVMAESSPEAPLELGLPVLAERRYGETLVRVHVSPEGQGTANPGGPAPDEGPAG